MNIIFIIYAMFHGWIFGSFAEQEQTWEERVQELQEER